MILFLIALVAVVLLFGNVGKPERRAQLDDLRLSIRSIADQFWDYFRSAESRANEQHRISKAKLSQIQYLEAADRVGQRIAALRADQRSLVELQSEGERRARSGGTCRDFLNANRSWLQDRHSEPDVADLVLETLSKPTRKSLNHAHGDYVPDEDLQARLRNLEAWVQSALSEYQERRELLTSVVRKVGSDPNNCNER